MSGPPPTRVVIADDHAIMREGLRRMIEAEPGLAVAGEAHDGTEVLARVRAGGFELLLLDMSMPGKSGIELIKQVRIEAPKLPILVLSMHAEEQYAVRSLRAGASGYLTKDSPPDLLIAAIRRVAEGGKYVSAALAERLATALSGVEAESLPHMRLSDREHEIFLALVAGENVSELAARLHLSVKTVSTHKGRVLEKMGMHSVAELVRYALNHSLVEND